MARIPLNKDAHRFDFRVGSNEFTLGGMMQDTDPGSTPPNRPRFVLNGRYQGGGIVSRPPFEFVDSLSDNYRGIDEGGDVYEAWDAKFIIEHHPTRFNSQLLLGSYDDDAAYVSLADQPFSDVTLLASYPTVEDGAPILERFSGELYVGDTGYLRRIYRIGSALADLPTDDILYTFQGFKVYAMHEFDGRLYVFVADPNASSNAYIFSYDGLQVYSEKTFGSTAGANGASFCEFKGKLFFARKGDTSLHYRDKAGSWASVTDGSFTHSGSTSAMTATGDTLWIAGDTTFSDYTEPSGTPTLNVTTSITPFTSVMCWTSAGGYLFKGGGFIDSGDTYQTPYITGHGPGGGGAGAGDCVSPTIQSEGSSDIVVKAMTLFCQHLYITYGFKDPANGGDALAYFTIPISCGGSQFGQTYVLGTNGAVAGASQIHYPFLKGDTV